MDEYAGFALLSEISRVVGCPSGNLSRLKGIATEKIAGHTAVRLDTLPEKYRPAAWHDLGEYLPVSALNELLAGGSGFISLRMKNKKHPMPYVKIGERITLVPTTEEFRALLRKGMVPFQLRGNEQYADIKSEFHGVKLGWY